jgi:UDP-2-acetamido-3-amino-2,3-dideoxy-glucuronate N-acetyltransferase
MSGLPANDAPYRLIDDVHFGRDVFVHSFTNLYGCTIGDGSRIGPFVEIQRGAVVGARCKIQSHVFICDGVEVQDDVFISHGVMFVNDKTPRSTRLDGRFQTSSDWELLPVVVESGATLGTGAIILGGVRIGKRALVGAGAVVTGSIDPFAVVAGVPAVPLRRQGSNRGVLD